MSKVVYICDPEKNTTCSKECCKRFGICRATTDVRFARLDENGKPIVIDRSVTWKDYWPRPSTNG